MFASASLGCLVGCSGTENSTGLSVGGASTTGGASAIGGALGSATSSKATASGGSSASFGDSPAGGVAATSDSAAPSAGGASGRGSALAAGGNTPTRGGAAQGGAATTDPPTGGKTSTGAPASTAASGGKTSTGAASTPGGASASGGASVGGGPNTGAKSAGCGKTSTLQFGAVPNESASATAASGNGVGYGSGGYLKIQSGGQTRGFAVRLPDNYDPNKPYWLIFGFHWNGGNSAQVDNGGTSGYDWAYYGLQKQSKSGAIFVAPDGLNAGWANSGGRDLTFTDDMVKLIEDNYCVDTTHIISTGFSYGGGMSYEIACARAKVFRAVAIFEGAQLSGCDGGKDPIALWQMAGTADTTCTVSMATSLRDTFVKNNGCTVQNPPQPASGSLTHLCTDYSGCSTGHPLRWCVHGSGHTPAPIDGSSSLYGPGSASWVPGDLWPWLTSL